MYVYLLLVSHDTSGIHLHQEHNKCEHKIYILLFECIWETLTYNGSIPDNQTRAYTIENIERMMRHDLVPIHHHQYSNFNLSFTILKNFSQRLKSSKTTLVKNIRQKYGGKIFEGKCS